MNEEFKIETGPREEVEVKPETAAEILPESEKDLEEMATKEFSTLEQKSTNIITGADEQIKSATAGIGLAPEKTEEIYQKGFAGKIQSLKKKITGLVKDCKERVLTFLGLGEKEEDLEIKKITSREKTAEEEITEVEKQEKHDIDFEKIAQEKKNLKKEIKTLRVKKGEIQMKLKEEMGSGYLTLEDRLKKIDKDKRLSAFQKMIERVNNETKVFREIDDTVGEANIINAGLKGKYEVPVYFGKKEITAKLTRIVNKTFLGKRKWMGAYNSLLKNIVIEKRPPPSYRMWGEMTSQGYYDFLSILDHELVHAAYDKAHPNLKSKMKNTLKGVVKNTIYYTPFLISSMLISAPTEVNIGLFAAAGIAKTIEIIRHIKKKKKESIITETLAHKAQETYGEFESTMEIVERLIEKYGFKKSEDIDIMIALSGNVNRLKALGMTDKEIARLAKQDSYDSKSASFPLLEKKVEEMANSRGSEIEDIDLLVDANRIKRDNRLLQARKIALEELIKFFEVEQSSTDAL